MPSERTVLVTGGCGFIGGHLVRMLHERGERVRVLDRCAPAGFPAGVDFIEASILDEGAVRAAMAGVDCVFHLAGIAHLWTRDKADFERINAQGTRVVLGAAHDLGVARAVHCSTEAILLPKRGTRGGAIDGSALPPASHMPGPYARSKRRAEEIALDLAARGLGVVIVNPTVPVGPGDRNRTPPAEMLALFLSGGSPAYLECILNLVDVRDVAAGMLLAEERGRPGERYVLGGENFKISELLRVLGEISGRPMPRFAIPAAVAYAAAAVSDWAVGSVTRRRPVATVEGVRLARRSLAFDSRKAREELGYAPRAVRPALIEAAAALGIAVAREGPLPPPPVSESFSAPGG